MQVGGLGLRRTAFEGIISKRYAGTFFQIAANALAGLWAAPRLCRPGVFAVAGGIQPAAPPADLSNHIWVADIIFTRCAGPCPIITGRMKSLEDALPKTSNAKLVTLTTDPDYDTPAMMKRYGERFGADFSWWMLLTGTKAEIGALGGGSLKLSAVPVPTADQTNAVDLFIHTTIFVIVDKHARLRGSFETVGDGVDWTNAVQPRIIAAVRQLEREP
jgi:cytochrome oxidase Cu insertion factor (SCO1/SenC/PrrC family)